MNKQHTDCNNEEKYEQDLNTDTNGKIIISRGERPAVCQSVQTMLGIQGSQPSLWRCHLIDWEKGTLLHYSITTLQTNWINIPIPTEALPFTGDSQLMVCE